MEGERFFVIKKEEDIVRLRTTLKSLCKKVEFKVIETLHITIAITEFVRFIAERAQEVAVSLIAIKEDEQDGIQTILEIKGMDIELLERAMENFSFNGREERLYMIKHLVDQLDIEKKKSSVRIIIKKWKEKNSYPRR